MTLAACEGIMSDDSLRDAALDYHRHPRPGKLAIRATKPLANQRDLALAYTPGVAFVCEAIVRDPGEAFTTTARANLVAVVSNGTAVLGLGAIGPLAAKPVMEGKAVLFKTFAGIDVFDIEIDQRDPDRLVETVAGLEPTFGAINLEDIKAPECFEVEEKLRARMGIPVFHDDQHGTAICVAAAMTNGLRVVGKRLEEVRVVTAGAGAAALACLGLLVEMGLKREHVTVCDIHGVVYRGRTVEMDPYKARFARETEARTLAEAIAGADVFLGLSAPGVLSPEMLATMAAKPLVLALANPVPEIDPEVAKAARPDAVIATGRSDYPNQVNNVLCFPFIFRGALDVGASEINTAMKIACARALAGIALAEPSDVVARAYGGQEMRFGADYIMPRPFDPRLIVEVPSAVARAAMESGVARHPIADFEAYRQELAGRVYRTGYVMRSVFAAAKVAPKRLVYTEGEAWRILQAVQIVCDEGFARPIVIGRAAVVASRIERLGLRIRAGADFELCDPTDDPRFRDYWQLYHRIMERNGVTPAMARTMVRTQNTVIGALMVRRGEADAVLAGPLGSYREQLRHVLDVIGLSPGVAAGTAMQMLVLDAGIVFIADTHITPEPDEAQVAEIAILAAEEVRRFGIEPKVALVSHSNFGSYGDPAAGKMRRAAARLRAIGPDFAFDGEMHADLALSEKIRAEILPNARLEGAANLLVMPSQDAAHISFNLLKVLANGIAVGPMLIGAARPAQILNTTVTVRGVLNMSALAVVDAQTHAGEAPATAGSRG